MQKNISIFLTFLRADRDTLANHSLVLIAFFLTISGKTVGYLYSFLLILFLLKNNKPNIIQLIKNNSVVLAIVLYVIMYFCWTIISNDFNSAFDYAKKTMFLLYIIVIITFLKQEFIPRILTAFILGVFVSEIFSYSLAFEWIKAPFLGSQAFASVNNPSPFMYHIHYSFILAFTAYLLLETIKRSTSLYSRVFAIIFICTITINLVLNIGRTGYILYIVGVILFIILNYKKQSYKIIPLALVGLIIVFTLAYQFSYTYQKRVDLTFNSLEKMITHNQYQSSLGLRVEKNKLVKELAQEKPFFGYGTGQHIKVVYNAAKEKTLWYVSTIKKHGNLDSEYLDIIMQFGLIGLLIFLNIFYQTLTYKQGNWSLKKIQLVVIIFYILFSFVNVGIIHHKLSEFFLFFISITLIQVTDQKKYLDRISYKEIILYILIGGLLFIRSLFHFSAPINNFLRTTFS